MLKVEKIVTPSPEQWEIIIEGMRNPKNSWDRMDSYTTYIEDPETLETASYEFFMGDKDLELAESLAKGGSVHAKYRRMIPVYMTINAPMYWWSEFDTYKIGTVANSCSKMHKMLAKPFEMSDFSFDKLPGYKNEVAQFVPDFDYDKEVWKSIGKTGYYVSNFGRIKKGNRVLAGSHHSDGYIFTTVKGDQIPTHRIVASAFIPNPNNLPEVNHKDGNKMNNSVENLEWVTRSANQKHAVDMCLQPKGISKYTGKFTEEERNKIKEMWNSGEFTRREIARQYNVSHTCINDILNEKYLYATKVNVFETVARPIVDTLNELRDSWIRETDEDKKKQIWYAILQLLPVSYNQKRTIMMNYEVLANIYRWRKDHKLDEWHVLCEAIEKLPYSELITGEKV